MNKTTLKWLSARYRKVLVKCALINAMVFAAATNVFAAETNRQIIILTQDKTFADIDITSKQPGLTIPKIEIGGIVISQETFIPTSGDGGAISNHGGNFTINGQPANLSNNLTSNGNGGAIANVSHIANFLQNAQDFLQNSFDNLKNTFLGNRLLPDDMGFDLTSLYNGGTGTIDTDVTFNGNTANNGDGGAIYNYGGGMNLEETGTFENNTAGKAGGAIWNNGFVNLKEAAFFESNVADTNGGAIANEGGLKLLADSSFNNNYANEEGGAIYNTGLISFGDYATLTHNTAGANGGAIANSGNLFFLNGGLLANNQAAAGEGGAIYNSGAAYFSGDFDFYANNNSTDLNDIYNTGTLEFNNANVTFGNAGTLDFNNFSNNIRNEGPNGDFIQHGGINGNGIVNFTDSSINAYLSSVSLNALISSSELNADNSDLNFIIENAWNGNYVFLNNSYNEGFNMNNSVYNLENDAGVGQTVNLKKISELQTSNGLTQNQATILYNMVNGDTRNDITVGIQGPDVENAKAKLAAMDPNTNSNNSNALSNAAAQANAANARMAAFGLAGGEEEEEENCFRSYTGELICTGRSGGERLQSKFTPWISGMYNHTKNTQEAGFTSNSTGFALGAESYFTPYTLVGVGFSRTNGDIKSNTAKTEVETNGAFLYAKYKPADWYVQGTVNYSRSEYEDSLNSEWKNNTYGLQAYAGYVYGIADSKVGLRYTTVRNRDYVDGFGNLIESKNAAVTTAVVGTELSKDFDIEKDFVITPLIRAAFTYDLQSNGNVTNFNLAGTSTSFQLQGERLKRAAIEAGVGLKMSKGNVDIELAYDGQFREKHESHTGLLKLKYNF